MATQAQHLAVPRPFWRGRALTGTLPLILLTGALFVAAIVSYYKLGDVGPAGYPLWGLLITLGFIGSIGVTFSAYYAAGEAEAVEDELGEEPSSVPEPLSATSSPDFGRPRPEVVRHGPAPAASPVPVAATARPARPPWDEEDLPPPIAHPAPPSLSAPLDPSEIERALAEIAEIQADLEGRRDAPPPSRPSAARP
jgi:hypothetical protein